MHPKEKEGLNKFSPTKFRLGLDWGRIVTKCMPISIHKKKKIQKFGPLMCTNNHEALVPQTCDPFIRNRANLFNNKMILVSKCGYTIVYQVPGKNFIQVKMLCSIVEVYICFLWNSIEFLCKNKHIHLLHSLYCH